MTYTPEQLRDQAAEEDAALGYVSMQSDLLRAHAAALEELARMKAPADGEIAEVAFHLAHLAVSLEGDDRSALVARASTIIESLAAKVAELEGRLNCTQMDRDHARKDAYRAEAALEDCRVGMQAAILQRDQERVKHEAALANRRREFEECDKERIEAQRALAESERKCERLAGELGNIANAKYLEWDAPNNTTHDFHDWAKSRARHALAAYRAEFKE